jgi:iron complex outermembrane receptor protein
MVQGSSTVRKAMFALSSSALALAVATPALAQDATNTTTDTQSKPQVTPDQIAGEVGPAQVRKGDNGEIVVTGIRASIQASLNAKRNNDMVSEVITAQDIGKFPDKNVADSLGRLTGVNVVTGSAGAGGFGENSSVSIRGTDPTLNLTLLDGHSIATGDWFVLDQTSGGRSFDFSLLPSEIVGKIEVYKSSQADLPEGGIGGTINLHSRMPLDLPAGTVTVTAQGNYNDLARKWEPQVSGLFSWKDPSHSFGILGAAFYQKRAFRRDGQEFLGYSTYQNFGGSGETAIAPNLIGEAYFRQMRIRKGGTLAAQWKPSNTFELALNGIYTRMDANNVNSNSMAWISNVANGAADALTDYTITNGVVTSATWASTTPAGAPVNGRVQDDIFRDSLSSTWVVNAEAKWRPTAALTVAGELGYTKGKGETRDTYAWETYWHTGVSYTIDGKTASVTYPDLPSDPTSAAYLNNYYSWSWGGHIVSPDSEKYAKADLEYALGGSWLKSIKLGGRYTDHKHSLNYIAYSWPGNGANSGTQNINLGTVFAGETTPGNYGNGLGGLPGYSLADRALVLQALQANGGRIFDFYPQASFSVHEKDSALYAMAKFDNDSNWRGNIGVRAVHTDLATIQYTGTPTPEQERVQSIFCPGPSQNDPGGCGIEPVNHKYWDILPSANMTYNVRPDLLLRASAARVMARPGYAQLAGAFTLNDTILTGTAGGNPYLKPTRAWEFNAGAEWYFGKQSLLSATLFYLDIDSYITQATFTGFYTTLQHPNGATFTITGPVNGPGGTNKGVELNFQMPLGYGFGVISNYTYADAKNRNGGPIDGSSKHTYNLTGYFENSLISTRLAYTYRSKFQSGIDRATPMWQDNYGQLDGSLIVHVTRNLDFTADAQNLLNHKLYYFVGNPSIPRAYYNNGRTFWVGAKATF